MCSLDKLLADLDNEDTSVALDAQISLEDRGEEAIKPILSLLPSLDFYGQSCALDLLTHIPHFGKVASKKPNFASRQSVSYDR